MSETHSTEAWKPEALKPGSFPGRVADEPRSALCLRWLCSSSPGAQPHWGQRSQARGPPGPGYGGCTRGPPSCLCESKKVTLCRGYFERRNSYDFNPLSLEYPVTACRKQMQPVLLYPPNRDICRRKSRKCAPDLVRQAA